MRIGFATSNKGKFLSASEVFREYGISLEWIMVDLPEPRGDLEEVALSKLDHASEFMEGFDGIFVIDSGAYISGLEWPGQFTNFELRTLGMRRILKIAEIEGNDSLEFRNVLAFKGFGEERLFMSVHKGKLATTSYGEYLELKRMAEEMGFVGWSPLHILWVPEGFSKPWFLLSKEERKAARSYSAIVMLAEYLSNYL